LSPDALSITDEHAMYDAIHITQDLIGGCGIVRMVLDNKGISHKQHFVNKCQLHISARNTNLSFNVVFMICQFIAFEDAWI
jgi:hypothetical protein